MGRIQWRRVRVVCVVTFLLPNLNCAVVGFAPSSLPSNAVLDAIGKLKTTMNKNQEQTMDILNELRASIQALANVNTAADAVVVQDHPLPLEMPVPTVQPAAAPAQQVPIFTIAQNEAQPILDPSAKFHGCFPEVRPDSFGVWFTTKEHPSTQQVPKSHGPQPEQKLISMQPDLPFVKFYPTQTREKELPRNTLPWKSHRIVALPPDQPFRSCGQQLANRQREYNPTPSSAPSYSMGIPPDQPFSDLQRRQQGMLQQEHAAAIDHQVHVVAMHPDQPFGHLNLKQRHASPTFASSKSNGPKIVAFRPDQLL